MLPFELTLPAGAGEATAAGRIEDEVLALFDDCAPGLHRYLQSRGLSADAADDVVQDTFLALYRHLCLGRARGNLRGWIFEVGRRLGTKHQARIVRRRHLEVSWEPAIIETALDPRESAEHEMAANQRRQRLRRVVRALPDRDRQCLLLRAEGLQYREIARTLGLSLGGVAKALARAFSRIANSERE